MQSRQYWPSLRKRPSGAKAHIGFRSSRGSIAIPSDCSLKVETRGPVTLRGIQGDRVTYTIKKTSSRKIRSGSSRSAECRAVSDNGAQWFGQYHPGTTDAARGQCRDGIAQPARPQARRLRRSAGMFRYTTFKARFEAESGGGLIQMDRIGSDVIGQDRRWRDPVRRHRRLDPLLLRRRARFRWIALARNRGSRPPEATSSSGRAAVRIHTSTAGGNIQIQRAAAMVSARTSGGRIEVLQANGIVLADNSGGSIQVGSATGVRVASAGGSIRLRGSSGSLARGYRCREYSCGIDERRTAAGFDSQHRSW